MRSSILVPSGRRAQEIAKALGLPLIAPQVDGLMTFDGSHLEPASAARWSAAFLEAAGPVIQDCAANRPRSPGNDHDPGSNGSSECKHHLPIPAFARSCAPRSRSRTSMRASSC